MWPHLYLNWRNSPFFVFEYEWNRVAFNQFQMDKIMARPTFFLFEKPIYVTQLSLHADFKCAVRFPQVFNWCVLNNLSEELFFSSWVKFTFAHFIRNHNSFLKAHIHIQASTEVSQWHIQKHRGFVWSFKVHNVTEFRRLFFSLLSPLFLFHRLSPSSQFQNISLTPVLWCTHGGHVAHPGAPDLCSAADSVNGTAAPTSKSRHSVHSDRAPHSHPSFVQPPPTHHHHHQLTSAMCPNPSECWGFGC